MTRPARSTLICTSCIVFKATFDSVENRWIALQNYELLRARKFAENAYNHELARELRSFGYSIRNQARGISKSKEFLTNCVSGSRNGMQKLKKPSRDYWS
jgi:TrwC relaxase